MVDRPATSNAASRVLQDSLRTTSCNICSSGVVEVDLGGVSNFLQNCLGGRREIDAR
jgi:hypothetical protein